MQLKSIKDTKNFSKSISELTMEGDVIFLYGDIGVGKTTFVRFFINHLENKNKLKNSDILSPTFNIVYDYDVGKLKILHYDLYRIKNCEDIFTNKLKDYGTAWRILRISSLIYLYNSNRYVTQLPIQKINIQNEMEMEKETC